MNFSARLERLHKLLSSIPCEALLVQYPLHLFYLTGINLSAGKLALTKQDCCLFVDGRYLEICEKKSPCPVLQDKDNFLMDWLKELHISQLAIESELTIYQDFLALKKNCEEKAISLIPVPSPVLQLRMIKDAEEIQLLRKAGRLAHEGYQFLLTQLEEGVKEEDLALELEIFWRRKGGQKVAFESIIAFGPTSSMPHYRAGSQILKRNTHILLDIGVVWQHYHSDMTRVVFFGQPHPEIQKIYPIVEQAKEKALSLCRPGTLIRELDQAAREHIGASGYGPAFTHNLGHGVGLEIHEAPKIRSTGPFSEMALQTGLVITIEPGIYLPDIGGVRLEDTILITDNGYENLIS